MRRILVAALIGGVSFAPPADAQSLRDRFIQLFTFGDCGVALCLGGTSQLLGHGDHFIPAAAAGGQAALDFVTNAVATNVSNVPIPATGGGAIVEFVDGLPVRTDLSAGPIFAERAQTLGQGRLLMGLNATAISLRSVRGIPLDNLLFNFGHEDIDPSGLGTPDFENDIIQVRSSLDVDLYVATAYVNYGLLDGVDLGVAVPFVNVQLSGSSAATILPFGTGGVPVHIFEGTTTDPVLVAVSSVDASASGIGDIAARLKIRLSQGTNVGFGIIGEVRLPTGDEDDLLGAGEVAVRGTAILSGRWGDFSPHINAGYIYRKSALQSDAALTTVGFDQLLAPWATLAVDLVGEWQVGDSPLSVGDPIVFDDPFPRTVPTSLIPDRRDDVVDGSIGFKFTPSNRARIITNILVPMSNGGVQPTATWTAGLELRF